MTLFQAVVLGIVQGATEFLPISSSGHLRIVPAIMGWGDPGAAFTAVIQLGTMAAVLIYFRRDLWNIGRAWLASLRHLGHPSRLVGPEAPLDARMGWFIIVGTIPIGLLGLAFKDQIETVARSLQLIGATLVLLGLVLFVAERAGRRTRPLAALNLRDGTIIGIAQAMALVPGVSRSGATLTAGLFLNLERSAAARYSFLLSIPAVVLSGLFELKGVAAGDMGGVVNVVVATVIAFVVGYAAIAWLLRFLATNSNDVFVGYRVVLGVFVLVFATTGFLH